MTDKVQKIYEEVENLKQSLMIFFNVKKLY